MRCGGMPAVQLSPQLVVRTPLETPLLPPLILPEDIPCRPNGTKCHDSVNVQMFPGVVADMGEVPQYHGFGPFGEHAVNASWIAVQELEKLGLGDEVDLKVYEVPVEYQTVQRLIPEIWKKHRPQLIVHVGVSGMATMVTIEKCGHNVGYAGLDNCNFCPITHCCVDGGPACLHSVIDIDAVCKRASAGCLDVQFTVSTDAGRYLCDFTYYTSLYQSRGKSVFIHVPPIRKPYTGTQLGRAVQTIIKAILDLLEQSEDQINCHHKH
ncbi:pyroglutamyl-peptidase 1 [Pelodytes ibericus]